MKRRELRAHGRRRMVIVKKVDRGELILKDPDKYFSEARQRALAEVRRVGQASGA